MNGRWVNWGIFKLIEFENPDGEPMFVLERVFLMKNEKPKNFVIPQESLLELESEKPYDFRYCKKGMTKLIKGDHE